MKILCTVTYFDPYISGLSLYAKRLAEGLVTLGNSVTILTMRHENRLPLREKKLYRIIRAVPFIPLHKGFLSFDFIRQSWKLVQTHDVLVVHLPEAEGFVAALFARLHGKRIISVYHCEVVLPEGFIHSIVQTMLEIANVITLICSDKVVTYTTDYANHSRLLQLVKSKVVAIRPPVSTPKSTGTRVLKYRKQIGKTDVVIGVAARLAAEKGIEYLFEALPLIQKKFEKQQIKIVIAGPLTPVGEEAYKTKIMTLVKKYKKNVVMLGEIAFEDMGSFYTCIDVLAVPSVNSTEAFGLVQVEAMMMGKPVVASDLPGVRVPIQKTGMGIIVPVRNAHALSKAIVRILNNSSIFIKKTGDIRRIFSEKRFFSSFEKLF